jgi:hypothetical protein
MFSESVPPGNSLFNKDERCKKKKRLAERMGHGDFLDGKGYSWTKKKKRRNSS